MKKEIISLSGDAASGKGTCGKMIAEKLGYEIYSASKVFRQMAREMDMTIGDFLKYVETRPHLDLETEERMKAYADSHDKVILDGRMAWYVAPYSFKVYMKVNINVAAERIFNDNRGKEDSYDTLEETKEALLERYKTDNDRYLNVYGVDKSDEKNYDLVFDTTDKTPDECTKIILDAYKAWLEE